MSKKGILKPQSISVTKVLLVVSATPGITTAQIAAQTGLALSYVRKVQDVATQSGLMGCVPIDGLHGSRGRGWYAAKDLQAARTAWDAIATERLQERRKKKLAWIRERSEPAMKGSSPVHRKVPAKSKRPLPFVVSAPNSVFALGGGS